LNELKKTKGKKTALSNRLIARAINIGEATPKEREAATKLIASHGVPAFCRALLNSNELIYLD